MLYLPQLLSIKKSTHIRQYALFLSFTIAVATPQAPVQNVANYTLTTSLSGNPAGQQGCSVSMSGDGSIVAAGDPGPQQAVWIFEYQKGNWSQDEVINGTVRFGYFGSAIALSQPGDTLAVTEPTNVLQPPPAVHVYIKENNHWIEQQVLMPDDNIGNAHFAYRMSLSGDGNTLVVGGPIDNNNKGAVWVYTRSGTQWSKLQKITAPNSANYNFGGSLQLSQDGNTLVVGTLGGWPELWIYQKTNNNWILKQTIADLGLSNIGQPLAISPDAGTMATGWIKGDCEIGIYKNINGIFQSQQNVTLLSSCRSFGLSDYTMVLATNDRMLIGNAYDESAPKTTGSVLVFENLNGTWVESQKIIPPAYTYFFGASLAASLNGSTIAIGAPNYGAIGEALVYVDEDKNN